MKLAAMGAKKIIVRVKNISWRCWCFYCRESMPFVMGIKAEALLFSILLFPLLLYTFAFLSLLKHQIAVTTGRQIKTMLKPLIEVPKVSMAALVSSLNNRCVHQPAGKPNIIRLALQTNVSCHAFFIHNSLHRRLKRGATRASLAPDHRSTPE